LFFNLTIQSFAVWSGRASGIKVLQRSNKVYSSKIQCSGRQPSN